MDNLKLFLIDVSKDKKWHPISVNMPFCVGKREKCDLVIEDSSVSGLHAKIAREGDDFVLLDQESTNGTRVNGNKVNKEIIRDSDIVSFGYVNYMVKICENLPRLHQLEKDETIALAILPFHIGRSETNQLILDDSSISNKHAVITEKEGKFYIKDLGSTNGVRVNGRRIQEAEIADGDTVKVGRWESTFLCQETVNENFFLRFLEGHRSGDQVAVDKDLSIGRTGDNDISLPSSAVSSKHAKIFWTQGRLWIADLKSRNGVSVNGIRIKKASLKHGDEIKIGKSTMLLQNTNLPQEKFYLVFIEGEQGGEEIELLESSLLIGRNSRCQICLKKKDISGTHAEIVATNGVFMLQDRGSTNGTYLNQKRIKSSVTLQHGDEVQVGSQKFIFRSSGKARPMALKQEGFVLLPIIKNRYGKPIRLQETTTIGRSSENNIVLKPKYVSEKHAVITKQEEQYTIKDLQSLLGTIVNGEKVKEHVLEHGDEIVIGPCKYIMKSSLRPLQVQSDKISQETYIAIAAGVLFVMFLLYSLIGISQQNNNDRTQTVDNNKTQVEKVDDSEILAECQQMISPELVGHRYWKAVDIVDSYRKKLSLRVNKQKLKDLSLKIKDQAILFDTILREINNAAPLAVDIPQKGRCIIKEAKIKTHSLIMEGPDKEIFIEFWEKIPATTFFSIADKLALKTSTLTLAEMALEQGYVDKCEEYLVTTMLQQPNQKGEVASLFAKAKNLEIPKGGFIVYENRLVTPDYKEKLESKKARDSEREKRWQELQEREKQRIEKERLSIEKQRKEFEIRLPLIEEYVRTYSYNKAISEFKNLLEEISIAELREKITNRITEIEPNANLFTRLIESINQKKLANNRVELGAEFYGEIVSADEEQFTVIIPNGQIRHRWYYLAPRKIYEFFNRMWQTKKDLFQIGVFCFENELLAEGNTSFIRFVEEYPKERSVVDNYISQKFEVPIPEGGFVAYQGRLISPEEREFLTKGLVRYGGRWVTPEDKEKLKEGYTKDEGGRWVSRDERALVKRGYVKYKDKWYTRAELNEIRSNWEDAWEITTAHYNLRSNISEEFLKDWGQLMETVFAEYEKFFGKTVKRRMTLYAFKGYEDYRNYCLEVGQANLLRAGGFATKQNNTAVGWRRDKNSDDILLNTMVHEGAHLYFFNAHPSSSSPSWISEAIATQFEGFTWKNKKLNLNFISQNRLYWLKSRQRNLFTIEELIQGQALNMINQSVEDASTFYAQCWALLYFFRNTNNKEYKKEFEEFLEKVNRGSVRGRESQEFFKFFQDDIQDIEKDWKKLIFSLN